MTTQSSDDRAVYTVREVAELFGITEKTVYDMVRRGAFEDHAVIRLGSVIRFSRARIDELLGIPADGELL